MPNEITSKQYTNFIEPDITEEISEKIENIKSVHY